METDPRGRRALMRNLPALLLCLLPFGAQAQTAGAADILCLSVGGEGIWTQVAIYGADNTALVMAVPPPGVDAPMESYSVTLPPDAFPNMVAVLRPGLADLPPPPDAEACEDDTLGPVTMVLRQSGAETLRYVAPCPTAEVLALNDALIAATGDPSGEQQREWTGAVVPGLRDICRAIP